MQDDFLFRVFVWLLWAVVILALLKVLAAV